MRRRRFLAAVAKAIALPGQAIAMRSPEEHRGFDGVRHRVTRNYRSAGAMIGDPHLRAGDLCRTPDGLFEIVPARAYAADGKLAHDLSSAGGQAVRVADTFPDVARELRSDPRSYDSFHPGQHVVTSDNAVVEVAPPTAEDYHFMNAGGVKFYAVPQDGTISLGDVGLGAPGQTEIGDTLLRIWAFLARTGGGTIFIPPGRWTSGNCRFPRTANTIRIVAHPASTILPSQPVPGTFMWDFLSEGEVTRVEFDGVTIAGPATEDGERTEFNGIRVGNSNYLRVSACHARFVRGTAWMFVRNFNSTVELRTFKCGDAAAGLFAMHMTGDTETDAAFNDVRIAGTSEQDHLGWLFEAGALLFGRERIKLHGRNDGLSERVLQIHRVSSFDLAVEATLGWSGPSMVHISDSGSGDGIALKQAVPSAMQITRGQIDIKPLHTLRAVGNDATLDMLTVDLATPGSALVVSGALNDLAPSVGTGIDYNLIGLSAPGNPGVEIDLSGLRDFSRTGGLRVSDRRTAAQKRTVPVAASPALPVESSARPTSAASRAAGEMVSALLPGSGQAPPVGLFGVAFSTEPGGTSFAMPWHTISGAVPGRVAARQRLVTGQRPLVGEDATGGRSAAILVRATIGAAGVPEGHDPSNHWVVDLYVGTRLAQSLTLARARRSIAAEDGLPSFVDGDATIGFCLDYWQGLAPISCDADAFFAAVVRPVGRPAPLEDICAQFAFSNRI